MKSTFQKPDATYPHGSLREQPEMKVPGYYDSMKELRVIPCSENNWKDGQELQDTIDYNVFDVQLVRAFSPALGIDHKKLPLKGLIAVPVEKIPAKVDSNPLAFYSPDNGRRAVPIVAQETEDELYLGISEMIFDQVYWPYVSSDSLGDKFEKEIFACDLKSKFTIQRRKQ